MKKYFLVCVSTSFVYFLVVNALPAKAVQGTCSDHGGVDCSAMADWDGSAICNDGWRDSSELYSSVQECKIGRHYCTTNESNQIDLKYDIAKKTKIINDISDQLLQLSPVPIPTDISGSALRQLQIDASDKASKSLALLSQYYSAQADYWNANNQADRECYALGDEHYYKNQAEFLKQLELQDCQTKYGINSYSDNGHCYCFAGYQFNTAETSCISNIDNSPYQNIRDRKIYRDVRIKYVYNSELSCNGLSLTGEDLAMCQAFAEDSNKDKWVTIDKSEPETVTAQSLLEKAQIAKNLNPTPTILPTVAQKSAMPKPVPTGKPEKIESPLVLITNVSRPALTSESHDIANITPTPEQPKTIVKSSFWKTLTNSVNSFFRKFKFW